MKISKIESIIKREKQDLKMGKTTLTLMRDWKKVIFGLPSFTTLLLLTLNLIGVFKQVSQLGGFRRNNFAPLLIWFSTILNNSIQKTSIRLCRSHVEILDPSLLCSFLGSVHTPTTSFHPQANGLVEPFQPNWKFPLS